MANNIDKVALITGAGSGLGKATADCFSAAGFAVASLDIKFLETKGSDAVCANKLAVACDVADQDQVQRAVRQIVDRFGRIDVAINCAGIDHTYWLEELTGEQFDPVLAGNLRGPFLIAKAVWPLMRAQGGGHIVNVASTAALRAWTGASAYHASKFGLLGMGRGLGVEGRDYGIRVTTIIPGGMNTDFLSRFVDQGIPLPDPSTLQDPSDVARTILFATSSPAGAVVQEIIVTPLGEPSWP